MLIIQSISMRVLLIALLVTTLWSCTNEAKKTYTLEFYRLSDIYKDLKSHLGERARVIGYLYNRNGDNESPNFVLLGAEYESGLNDAYTYRFSLWLDHDEAFRNKEALFKCENHYVIITGTIGHQNIFQSFVIENVEAIFSVEKENVLVCYTG